MNALSFCNPGASALLDLTESALKARPLRSWGAAQKEVVRRCFAAIHRDWSAEWIPLNEVLSASVDVDVLEPEGTMALAADGIAYWSFAEGSRHASAAGPVTPSLGSREKPEAILQAIAYRMFSFDITQADSAPVAPTIAPAVVRAAWADWLQRMGRALAGCALEPQQSARPQEMNAPPDSWLGALCVRLAWCGGVWSLGLPHAVVAALLGGEATMPSAGLTAPRLPKVRLDQALAGQRVALRVMLDGAELNLGQLQELRLDDVVALQHALDSPALVMGTDGIPLCNAWLGQSEGHIAVELAVPVFTQAFVAKAAAPVQNTHSSKDKKP